MKLGRWFMLVGLLLLAMTTQAALPVYRDAVPERLELDGSWQILTAALRPGDVYSPDSPLQTSPDWQPIHIPSNWYAAGYDLSGEVWHRRWFDWQPGKVAERAMLVFQAVDYTADVWINGHYAGFHEGYFAPFSVDVTPWLQSGRNLLVVKVNSPDEMPGKTWSLHKALIKGVLNHHDTRPGGAWDNAAGQDANSGGIWGSVWLERLQGLPIVQLAATLEPATEGQNDVIRLQIAVAGTPPQAPLEAMIQMTPDNFRGKSFAEHVTLQPEGWLSVPGLGQVYTLKLPAADLQRWWPRGYGPQSLYKISITVGSADMPASTMTRRTGFRAVRFDPNAHAFLINGRRLFLRGTNYIASPWLSTVSPADYRRDIRLMLEANINAVRVHAHVAGQAFYEVADEEGLLVWQDFPLQWGYDDSDAFRARAVAQAGEMRQMLAHHPAVFAWCGHNEPPWNAPWMKYKYPDYRPTQNVRLTQEVAAELGQDTSRYNHPFSSTDEHLWMGWYSGSWRDHARKATVDIVSEFGAQALPDEQTFKTIIPEADWWPKSTDPKDPAWNSWEYRNFQPMETFNNARVQRGDSIRSFIANSQQYQARLVQLAAESYRRQRYQPVAAAFHFLFAETWPSINWGVVDYLRRPKQGYAALQQAFQPILPSIEWDADHIPAGAQARFVLWAINDTWQSYPQTRLEWRLLNEQGQAMPIKGVVALSLEPDSGWPVKELRLPPLAPGNYRLETWLKTGRKQVLGSNSFSFTSDPVPDAPAKTGEIRP